MNEIVNILFCGCALVIALYMRVSLKLRISCFKTRLFAILRLPKNFVNLISAFIIFTAEIDLIFNVFL